jgi:hypothetical protein
VQNVGDSALDLINNQCVYVDGVLQNDDILTDTFTLDKGDTVGLTIAAIDPASTTTYLVRVTTEDGTFTEATKYFG